MELEEMLKRPPNPKKNSNFCSNMTFWWMVPIFRKGYKSPLDTSDLFETLESQRSDKKGDLLETAWNKEVLKSKALNQKASLLKVLVRLFGPSIFCYGLRFAFVELFIKMMQPIALGHLIIYYSDSELDSGNIIFYSLVIILSSVASTLIYYPSLLGVFHTSLKLKIACASVIYRKALKLHRNTLQTVTVGHIVNLLSADLNSLDLICYFCHNLWIGPLVTIAATGIMFQEIGAFSLVGVFLILTTIPFQGWLSKTYATLKRKGASKTDERLELMNEIIKGIQVIKMYAWEIPFTKLVSAVRRKEVLLIKYALFIKGLHVAFSLFRTRTAIFVSILSYVLSGNILTARKAFVVYACFNAMRHTMTDFFTFAIEQAVVANVSIKRIEKFLLQPEIKTHQTLDDTKSKISIHLNQISAKCNNKTVLSNINLKINDIGLYTIIGPVGCGKTSLIHLILNEITPSEGNVNVNGSISFASQEPWLFPSSIQQNILFGSPLNKYRYNEVLRICSLNKDLERLPQGDKTIIGDRGASLSGGQKIRVNLARAIYKDADIYLLDDPFSALDTKVSNEIFQNCINTFLKEKICILITHQHQFLKESTKIILLNNGQIKTEGTYNELERDIWNFTHFKKDEDMKQINVDNMNQINRNGSIKVDKINSQQKMAEEQRHVGRISWKTYKTYLLSCGNVCHISFVFGMFILAQLSASSGDFFLKYWVNMEQSNKINDTIIATEAGLIFYEREFCVYVYTGITISTIIVTLASCFTFYYTSARGALKLHEEMFKSVMNSVMRFFNINPAGRILNRFSKDIETIDITLPYSMINCIQTILSIFGITIIVSIVNPWLILPTVIVFCLINLFRRFYSTVSTHIKRLENTTRSPVLNYVSTSLQGLTTIRAYNAQYTLQQEFDNNQDVHTTARFLNVASSRMFSVWLEIICATYLALVIFSFAVFGNEYGGNVGLAITQVMGMMGSIQWGVRQSSELETYMTSVERVAEYCDLDEKENTNENKKRIPAEWPNKGRIDFADVCLMYGPNEPPVLKHVSFSIEANQKIGIIGRTGSGKSSIINALFQLFYTKGSIFIDDIYINNMNSNILRSKISIIPQEPILFSGNIRKNLDPFNELDDHIMWNVLKQVHLSEIVNLDSKITENGSNLSVGQKQLICLARAIVRNNKILILDEATANIDPETNCLIQKAIEENFKYCTVITVAHRLENIIDSDKILVMEDGYVKEFDHPYILLQNSETYLSNMLNEAGENISNKFFITAQQNYQRLKKNEL